MNDEPFMDLVVQTVLFLELSDDRTVNQDAAIAMMEQIAATLHRLEPTVIERFVQYIASRAARTEAGKEREVIESMASNLGLTSD